MSGVEITWDELVNAVASPAEGAVLYLDRRSGRVVSAGDEPPGDHLVTLPKLGPREAFDDMRRFAAGVSDTTLRDRLQQAIQGRGASRRFRAALAASPGDQKQWLAFRDRSLLERITRWLETAGLEPLNPLVAAEAPTLTAAPDPRALLQDLTLLTLYAGSWEEERGARGVVRRAWKGYRFEVLEQLQQLGFLTQGRSSKSVFLTTDGVIRARELEARLVALSPPREEAGEPALAPRARPRTDRLRRDLVRRNR
jgi:hypothetical protein